MGRLLSFIEGVLFLCVCCLVLSNCGSNGCVDNRSSIPLAQFYSYDAQETALSVDSISIFGIGQPTDSMLLDSAVAVTQVYLPLRFTQDSTQYVIHYEQQGLSSPRYNDFVIDTCRYTRNILDSVSVTVPEITNKNVESIRIFYTVQTQTPDEE